MSVGLSLILIVVVLPIRAEETEFRKLDGKIWNPQKSHEWISVKGRVLQVVDGGVVVGKVREIRAQPEVNSLTARGQLGGGRMELPPGRLIRTEIVSRFFVANAPQRVRFEGAELQLAVFRRGVTNVVGSALESFDYGQPVQQQEIDAVARAGAEQARAESQRIQSEMDAKWKREAARVLAFQLAQASNGSPSFQLEVGKRYLRGDGVPADPVLARHWLNAARTNGLSEAEKLLGSLQ